MTSVIYSLWIVGRNGGLLFSKDIPGQKDSSTLGIDFNDKLRLASSWFGMCGISSQLSPQPLSPSSSGGIHVLKADTFDLHSYQTLTGTTFMMVTSPNYRNAASVLKDTVYKLYCDYVLKNPFYEADQVIKSSLFDQKIVESLSRYSIGASGVAAPLAA
ncbi:hypothetical protein M9434_000998 [Picochlorum sp. BPE23]|nr:hypothetical protein M9434_000998 [Picochlorum sp. BPE23]